VQGKPKARPIISQKQTTRAQIRLEAPRDYVYKRGGKQQNGGEQTAAPRNTRLGNPCERASPLWRTLGGDIAAGEKKPEQNAGVLKKRGVRDTTPRGPGD